MKGICLLWSRGRLISPSMPVGDDRYLNLSSQKRSAGRNLGGHRSVRRSGTTSRGTVVLVFYLRTRTLPRTKVLTIFVENASTHSIRYVEEAVTTSACSSVLNSKIIILFIIS